MRLTRRPVLGRIVVFHRVDPDVAARLLPSEWTPRTVGGSAIVVLSYTRLGALATKFLPAARASSHDLAYRVAAVAPNGARASSCTWVARRETSSLLGAHWRGRALQHDHGRAKFELADEATEVRLRVHSSRGAELTLHAACCGAQPFEDALIDRPCEVSEFFLKDGQVQPHGVLSRDADVIDAREAFAPEPLVLHELSSAFFDDEDVFPPGSFEVDAAWRRASTRLRGTHAKSALRPGRHGQATDAAPAFPAV